MGPARKQIRSCSPDAHQSPAWPACASPAHTGGGTSAPSCRSNACQEDSPSKFLAALQHYFLFNDFFKCYKSQDEFITDNQKHFIFNNFFKS